MTHALTVRNVSKSFGGIRALDDVSFALETGRLHALIGPNGAGKTTLVSVISGELAPDTGRIFLDNRDITSTSIHGRARLGLGRTYQVTSLYSGLAVRQNLELALTGRDSPVLGLGQLLRRYRPVRFENEVVGILEDFGLSEHQHALPTALSHGDRRRLELAMTICADPDVLLLDEPLAGLSQKDAEKLVSFVANRLKGEIPILLIEHDMDAVFDLADDITVLVNGGVLEAGTPAEVRASAEVQAAYLSENDDF